MELTATDRPHGAIDTIPAAVARNARDTPDAPALVQGRRVMTWGDLGARSFAMAASLQRLGITPAGRVTMHFGSTLTLDDAAACVGILCACACHPVVADQPHAARLRLMERVAPAFVVASADSGPLDYPIPVLWHHGGFLESPADGVAAISVATRLPGRDDVAMITSTSGTTAEPKLVPILHRTLAAAGRTCSELADLHAGDRMLLLATPHFTLFCFSIVPFWMGGAVILPEGRAGDTWARGRGAIEPTWAIGAPGKLALVGGSPAMRLRGDTPFRLVMSAGAPATEAAADAIAQGFRAPRVDFYGASESFSMAYDGRIATTLRIAGLDGDGMAEAAPGEPGEVQTTGDMVFAGYLDDPAQTAAAFTADGWYRTGDVGRIGPDGRLDLLGRLSEIINRGGVKIAPAEIEAPVLELPGVAEAAAFAIPDPALGEQPALAVVPHPGAELTARDIRRFLLGRLPTAKMPTRVFLLDALPVTAAGKVSRRDLAALLAPPDDPAGKP